MFTLVVEPRDIGLGRLFVVEPEVLERARASGGAIEKGFALPNDTIPIGSALGLATITWSTNKKREGLRESYNGVDRSRSSGGFWDPQQGVERSLRVHAQNVIDRDGIVYRSGQAVLVDHHTWLLNTSEEQRRKI